MTKKDLLTPIGITVGFAMVMFGIMANAGFGGFRSFIQLSSILIVLGGLGAAILVNFNISEVKLTIRVAKEAFKTSDMNVKELMALFVRLSEKARREGLLALETELEEVEDPFIKKGILLAVDGIQPEVINDIMKAEIVAVEERHQRGRAIIETAGEYAPAWGMIGTLIGLVLMLQSLTNPSTLGPQMAVALLTTFYGTLLANLVFIPMAGKLENKTYHEIFLKQIIIEGVMGVQDGQNPRILEEKLSAFLSEKEKRVEEEELPQDGTVGEAANEA
ncbi:flagellar motor protein MotP [Halobacillus karajensis]|uniref:Chemotaxis protein PomA n=1 Tax=Halobacillus karajensis TaxID=195088 RepID=A0A024P7G0_9BACI|nr:flagellar motor protein MotP [Halobacillus karajensis]CDQ18324.1 Chemotaxis protein PomA [Halobacillus karajensis]CDQ24678.1 Chemotaxis protein PomA [Halobacillus karajensis]CDQ29076.1 Chemotaxis protein PomA [Halobacillus karajensis]